MPYITPERRELLDQLAEAMSRKLEKMGNAEGDFNYVLSRLVGHWFRCDPRYHTIARITGVLENVKQEFYRRVAGGYEDQGIANSGDIAEYKEKKRW